MSSLLRTAPVLGAGLKGGSGERGESQPSAQGYSQLQSLFRKMGNHIPDTAHVHQNLLERAQGKWEIISQVGLNPPKPRDSSGSARENGKSCLRYGSNPPEPSGETPGSAGEWSFLLLISSLRNATPAEGSPAVFIHGMGGGGETLGNWSHQPLSPSFQQQNPQCQSCPWG